MINYRKEKRFDGKIVLPNKKRQKISLIFSVRPKNLNMSYDTKKVRKDLKKEGILKSYNINKNFYYEIIKARYKLVVLLKFIGLYKIIKKLISY